MKNFIVCSLASAGVNGYSKNSFHDHLVIFDLNATSTRSSLRTSASIDVQCLAMSSQKAELGHILQNTPVGA